jgi:hypothetical protein
MLMLTGPVVRQGHVNIGMSSTTLSRLGVALHCMAHNGVARHLLLDEHWHACMGLTGVAATTQRVAVPDLYGHFASSMQLSLQGRLVGPSGNGLWPAC